MVRILYISYDGMLEPLGQSQVLSYLEKLAVHHKIHLISFEKHSDWMQLDNRQSMQVAINNAGIKWYPLRYHKCPSSLATSYDIFHGIAVATLICHRKKIELVHARSYVPCVVALVLKRLFGLKYIFDMRGFWVDERTDGSLWKEKGRMYRLAKWFERRLLLSADCVISLTKSGVDEMRKFSYLKSRMPYFKVIRTCANLDLFRPDTTTTDINIRNRTFTLGYVGSVGVWYLFDEVLMFFMLIQKMMPDAKMYILNRGDHAYIIDRINHFGISRTSVEIDRADYSDVACSMKKMDAGIFFIKPVYSKLASSPTKLAEFLACGIPCVSNTNVGDMEEIIVGEKVGVCADGFSEKTLSECAEKLIQLSQHSDIKKRCRNVAKKYFSLDDGVMEYDSIYRLMTDSSK